MIERGGEKRSTAVVIISDDGDSILCGRRPDGKFAFPGGTIDEGETAIQAATREVSEETGLKKEEVDIFGYLGTYEFIADEGTTINQRDIFVAREKQKQKKRKFKPNAEFVEIVDYPTTIILDAVAERQFARSGLVDRILSDLDLLSFVPLDDLDETQTAQRTFEIDSHKL